MDGWIRTLDFIHTHTNMYTHTQTHWDINSFHSFLEWNLAIHDNRDGLGGHYTEWKRRAKNTLAPWCEELTHLKRPWCCERLRAGREGDDRGWDGWITSATG